MFELLVGRTPFRESTDASVGAGTSVDKHMHLLFLLLL